MAKRMQEQKGEEQIVATSKPTAMNLSFIVPTSSSSATSPVASKSPGTLTATVKPKSRMRINSKSDAASSSQVRLQDAYLDRSMDTATVKLVVTEEEPGDTDNSGSEIWIYQEETVTVKPIAYKTAAGKNPCIQ